MSAIDTPTLLGVWQSAPYLHDGSAVTLRDVLTTRNPEGRHGDTSRLSESELDELVAYLLELDQGSSPGELELPPPRDSAAPAGEIERASGCGCRLSPGAVPMESAPGSCECREISSRQASTRSCTPPSCTG